MSEMKKNAWKPKASARERRSWYFYDFGNSAYAAVVLLAVYSAYFKGEVVGGAEGTRLWGIAVGIAMLLVALTAPVLGAIADYAGTKKKILLFYTGMACFFTAMLFFVQKGDVVMGLIFFIAAEFAYRSAQVFYNSLLPDIAHLDEMGHISGNGWAIGSLGGIACLVVVLAAIMLIGGNLVVRLSFVFTALFFAASAAPSVHVPEGTVRTEETAKRRKLSQPGIQAHWRYVPHGEGSQAIHSLHHCFPHL